MVVDDGDGGVVERQIVAMYAACEVDVFGVHEEPFVKEACLECRLCAEQHKATAKVGDIHRVIVARGAEFVACIAARHKAFWQKTASKDVQRCGEEFAEILCLTVRRDNMRHQLPHEGVGVHKSAERVDIRRLQKDVRVQYEVVGDVVVDALAQCNVVSAAIAHVLCREDVLHLLFVPLLPYLLAGFLLGIIHEIYPVEAFYTEQFLNQRNHFAVPVGVI